MIRPVTGLGKSAFGADMEDALTVATFAMVMMCFAMFLIVI